MRAVLLPFMKASLSIAVTGLLSAQVLAGGLPAKAGSEVGMFNNKYYLKGGLGIIAKRLFVVAKSPQNELIVGDEKWIGKDSNVRQVVIVWNGQVLEGVSTPQELSLKDCVIISFEADKILFTDFHSGITGYYIRTLTAGQ